MQRQSRNWGPGHNLLAMSGPAWIYKLVGRDGPKTPDCRLNETETSAPRARVAESRRGIAQFPELGRWPGIKRANPSYCLSSNIVGPSVVSVSIDSDYRRSAKKNMLSSRS